MQRRPSSSGCANERSPGPAPAAACERKDHVEGSAWIGITQTAQSVELALRAISLQDSLSEEQFLYFKDIARRHAGIVIADFKKNMIARRIRTRLKALSIGTFDSYCELLKGPHGKRELQPLINALTTNKTEFFREIHHFEHLGREAVPLLSKLSTARVNRLRVWSAGCSTGEEPYSIAMTLHTLAAQRGSFDYRILATDIDTNVLAHAMSGTYRKADLKQLPPSYRAAFFSPASAEPGTYCISSQLKDRISFQRLNLHDHWPMKGPLDIIFCRNVVIYFDKATQRRLFERLADILTPGGLLYCGHSESLYGVCSRFRSIGQSIYQRLT